jgi:hypothetical protein
MTDDRLTRRLPELMHELAGNDERYLDGILAHTVRTRQRPAWTFPAHWLPVPAPVGLPGYRPQVALMLALVALLALLLATAVAYVGSQLLTDRPLAGSYEAAFLRRANGPGVIVIGVNANGREREIARLPGAWYGTSGLALPPMGAVSPTGLLAIPSGGTGGMMRWEIYDLHSPQADPIVVPGIAEQFIEKLRDRPSWRQVDNRGGVFWGPGDQVAIAWYPCTLGAGSCIVRTQLSFVDGRTGATGTVVLADVADDLFVAPVWASDGSGVFVAATDSSTAPTILHPDGTLTVDPHAVPYRACRLPATEPTPSAVPGPEDLAGGTGPGCLSPDGSMIAVDPGGYSVSRSQLVNVQSGESYSIDGTFAGWLEVSEDSPEPSSSPDPTDTPSPEADATDALRVTNGWIAFSTQPGYRQTAETDWSEGGDIYLVREGVEPMLIVDRGDEMSTNVCPAFSPDGSMLAYGTRTGPDRAVAVLVVSADGATAESTRLEVPGDGPAPCPRWSLDGQSVAYLQRDSAGVPDETVVVRRLDGEVVAATDADPGVEDFERNPENRSPLLSPTGEYVVGEGQGGITVARPDGSEPVSVTEPASFYAIAGWSTDGRQFLFMEDVSGTNFTMYAVSLDRPGDPVPLASWVPVNGARSWPGRGDVSWQPVHP